jgi:YozE SAM-like fold
MTRNGEGRPQGPALIREKQHQATNRVPPQGTSFTDWLRRQRHREGSVGSLAADMAGDGGWPEPASLQDLHRYLDRFHAPYFVHDALDVAWLEWRWSA